MFGAILGLAGSLYGANQQRKADKRAFAAQQANTERALGLLDAGETSASKYLREAMSIVEQANQRAMGQTAQMEFQGYRGLQDALGRGQSRLAQSMTNRGLYGTSASGAGVRSLYSDYARAVGSLSSQVGGLRAQLETNRGQQLASLYGSQAQNAAGFSQARAGLIGNQQFQGPQGLAESYGTLGASVGGILDSAGSAWSKWAQRRSQVKQANTALGGIGAAGNAVGQAFGAANPIGMALRGYGSLSGRVR